VHRLLAALLLAVVSFPLISPALLGSDADSNLAACCRRAGKHHCGMPANHSDTSSGPRVQARPCPLFPGDQSVPTQRAAAGSLETAPSIFALIVSHPASHPQTEALSRISFTRSCQKRGPPVFLS
jgi:hypothetical protein